MPTTIKLHKFLDEAGVTARSKAEALIANGQVSVNGHPAHVGQRVDPQIDTIICQGKKIKPALLHSYILVNKPTGVVSTTQDELNRKTVLSLIPPNLLKQLGRLYPVGRLDLESEGLILLTNDGELTQQVTHPKHQIAKTYHVQIDRYPSRRAIDHLRRGVKLKEGFTKPADVEILHDYANQDEIWLSITIIEGRNHQVRRMMERVGYDVKRLIRVQLGPWKLEQLSHKPYLDISDSAKHDLEEFMNQ